MMYLTFRFLLKIYAMSTLEDSVTNVQCTVTWLISHCLYFKVSHSNCTFKLTMLGADGR